MKHVWSQCRTLKAALSLGSVHVKPPSQSLSSFLILWASIEIHRDHYRPGVRSKSESERPTWGPQREAGPSFLSEEPLCHVSGLVRRWAAPCYWSAHLSRSPHSLPPSDYLISRRRKRPIPVIFYFVMKVSRGCEKEEMHHKSPPWENRVEWTLVCAGPTARWVDVLFTVRLRSPLWVLTWSRSVLHDR